MKKIFLLIIGTSILLCGCGKKEQIKRTSFKIVKTIIVQSNSAKIERSFPGIVKSSLKTDLSFNIAGRLIKLPIKDGQNVYKGQLIAKLEPDKQKYNLNSAQAAFLEAESDFIRYKELYAQSVISTADYQAKNCPFNKQRKGVLGCIHCPWYKKFEPYPRPK